MEYSLLVVTRYLIRLLTISIGAECVIVVVCLLIVYDLGGLKTNNMLQVCEDVIYGKLR